MALLANTLYRGKPMAMGASLMLHALAVALLVASVSSTPPAAHGVIRMTVVPVGEAGERRANHAYSSVASPSQALPEVSNDAPPAHRSAPEKANASESAATDETAPVFSAEYLNNPAPAYPRLSRQLGEQGKVLLRVRVTMEGRAAQIVEAQSSGSARLDEAARAAVRQWRFVPARRGGRAVDAWVLVPIVFTLET